MDEKEISKTLGFKSPSTVYGVIERFAPVEMKEKHSIAVCPVCGKSFLKKKKYRKYCSDACADSSRVTANVKKRALLSSQIIDNNITLSEVYKRNNGVCYLCGKECDYSDIYIKAGRKIYGNNYPSIDHVIPLQAGGMHSWDNVKLAHRICNTTKSILERSDRRVKHECE